MDLYAGCRAVFYAPYDEDYGYVTVEAFKAGKPVEELFGGGEPLNGAVSAALGIAAERRRG